MKVRSKVKINNNLLSSFHPVVSALILGSPPWRGLLLRLIEKIGPLTETAVEIEPIGIDPIQMTHLRIRTTSKSV